jgi:hypothetical protein
MWTKAMNFEQNATTAAIENEIAIFESFKVTALELGLAQAAVHLTDGISARRQAINRLLSPKKNQ